MRNIWTYTHTRTFCCIWTILHWICLSLIIPCVMSSPLSSGHHDLIHSPSFGSILVLHGHGPVASLWGCNSNRVWHYLCGWCIARPYRPSVGGMGAAVSWACQWKTNLSFRITNIQTIPRNISCKNIHHVMDSENTFVVFIMVILEKLLFRGLTHLAL